MADGRWQMTDGSRIHIEEIDGENSECVEEACEHSLSPGPHLHTKAGKIAVEANIIIPQLDHFLHSVDSTHLLSGCHNQSLSFLIISHLIQDTYVSGKTNRTYNSRFF